MPFDTRFASARQAYPKNPFADQMIGAISLAIVYITSVVLKGIFSEKKQQKRLHLVTSISVIHTFTEILKSKNF